MNKIHPVNPENRVNPVKGCCLGGVLRRVFLRFFHAFITTNRDFLAGHGYFDPTIIDRPITDRTFARVHEFVSLA